MPASAAASQPLAAGQPVATVTITRPVAPDPLVECGFCRVSRPSSQMVNIGGGQYRCDIRRPESDGCVQRYIRWRETGALPAPRLSAPLPPLPKRVPVAGPGPESSTSLTSANVIPDSGSRRSEVWPEIRSDESVNEGVARFNAIHDEQDAAEAAKSSTEDEEPSGAAAKPPALTTEPAPVAAGTETPDGGEDK
jgi:hypothetical protein